MTGVLDVLDGRAPLELPERRRFTREEFERAGALGLFEGERLELIGGEIVRKVTPQQSAHAAAIRRVEEALRAVFGRGFDVRVQLPLALVEHSEPEPDVSVVRGSFEDYEQSHPTEAVLVVKVSDTSLRFDRGVKACLYASARIQEYWVVNLVERVVEVHRDPRPDPGQPFAAAYALVERRAEGDPISPTAAPAGVIQVVDLLPARR